MAVGCGLRPMNPEARSSACCSQWEMLSSISAVCGLLLRRTRHCTDMKWVSTLSRTSGALAMAGPVPDQVAVSLNMVSHWFDGPSGRTQALADVDMQINAGEFFTVLGP